MTKANFTIIINASSAKVWQVLLDDSTYRKWTNVFQEGSYAVSDWKEGSKIQFLGPKGSGMYGIIKENKPKEFMDFKHIGVIKNFEEQPIDEETKSWSGSKETYSLKEENGNTELSVNLDGPEEMLEMFKGIFPKALTIVKELAEERLMITLEATINVPVEKAWRLYTLPEHIVKWNSASDDWHTTKAENDLRVGGKFSSRMEAKDGSFGFDFWGIYDEVKTNEIISYTLGDNRKAKVTFTNSNNQTKIVVVFEAETENPIEMQQGGWQAILNNFKRYTEAN